MTLDRATIRARLAAAPHARAAGDVATAYRLMAEGNLEAWSGSGYGAVHSSGVPYDQAAGHPGVIFTPMPAAVLVALIERPEGYSVLLTQRTDRLKHHAGQVALPGGRMEREDRDYEACALREAHEETGLDPTRVETLGRLRPYLTVTGYEVVPVVGAVTPPITLAPDPNEVADVFEVPLAFFLDAANHHRHTYDFNGLQRAYYAMPYGDRYIWGATAGMILNLYEALLGNGEPTANVANAR